MKIKRIISLIESLSSTELNLLERRLFDEEDIKEEWKWGKSLDFRFIESEIVISPYNEFQADSYNNLNDLNEEEWEEYVNDLAKYGVSIKYDGYEDEYRIYPSTR